MWWEISAHLIFSFFFVFFTKICKIHFFHRREFTCIASIQPGSCVEDPSE